MNESFPRFESRVLRMENGLDECMAAGAADEVVNGLGRGRRPASRLSFLAGIEP